MLYARVDNAPTVELATVLRHIAPLVPEVPYEMALDMVQQAYVEFGRRSQLLVSHYTLPMQRGVKQYPLIPPKGYEIFAVSDISDAGNMYRSFPDAHHWFMGWGTRFTIVGNRWIEFVDAPSRDHYARSMAFHLLPAPHATDIPTEVATPYGKGISMGALADMLEMPNQPWYNPNLAQIKRREFNRTVLSARELATTNRGSKTLMFKPVRVL